MSGFVAELGWRHLSLGSGGRGLTLSGSDTCLVPVKVRVNRRSRKIAGAAVNAKEMTSPVVTLGVEGQSLESPVPGNWPAGFGGGGGGDDPKGHRALPPSYPGRHHRCTTPGAMIDTSPQPLWVPIIHRTKKP